MEEKPKTRMDKNINKNTKNIKIMKTVEITIKAGDQEIKFQTSKASDLTAIANAVTDWAETDETVTATIKPIININTGDILGKIKVKNTGNNKDKNTTVTLPPEEK